MKYDVVKRISKRILSKNTKRVQVQSDYGWYQVYRLPGNVYAICEPQHFQEVNFFPHHRRASGAAAGYWRSDSAPSDL